MCRCCGMCPLLAVDLDPALFSQVISDLRVLSAKTEKLQQKDLGWLASGSTMTSFIWPGLSNQSRAESASNGTEFRLRPLVDLNSSFPSDSVSCLWP